MLRSTLIVASALAATAPGALAQRFLVAQELPPQVKLIDTSAGVLVEDTVFDLSNITPPVLGVRDAQRVGGEVWVSAVGRLVRFDTATQALLGEIDTGTASNGGMDVANGSVWVAARAELLEVAFDGVILARYPVDDAVDVFEWNGELIVANNADDRVDRYDFGGVFLGSIVSATAGGFLPPSAIAPRSNGNLLVVNQPRILEYDSAGTQVGIYQAGVFEQGVQEMADGRFFVTNADLASIYDASSTATGGVIRVNPLGNLRQRFVSPFDGGTAAFTRYCVAGINSRGVGAIVSALGFPSVSAPTGDLQLDVAGLPIDVTGLFVYGANGAQTPFGDGFLCIDGSGPAFRFPAATNTGIGRVRQDVDLSSLPAAGQITPGSSWNFQFLYRDRQPGNAGFNGSDAVSVTFRN